jgi:hypothetical protein
MIGWKYTLEMNASDLPYEVPASEVFEIIKGLTGKVVDDRIGQRLWREGRLKGWKPARNRIEIDRDSLLAYLGDSILEEKR